MEKTFLYPLILRRGQPVMEYVVREKRDGGGFDYWLGVYHAFEGRGQPAEVTDYKGMSRTRISKRLYDAFVSEAHANALRFQQRGAPLFEKAKAS